MTNNYSTTNSGSKGQIFNLMLVIILASSAFWAGTLVGSGADNQAAVTGLSNKDTGQPETVDFSPFWRAWHLVNEKHIDGPTVGAEEKVWGAIEGLLGSLNDPHTVFMDQQKSESFSESLKGQFEGVGMEVGIRDDVLTVVSPIQNTPAQQAGLQAGDKILEINGTSTEDMSLEEGVSRIKGQKGTEVKLLIFRDGAGEPFEVSIVRDVIDIPILATRQEPSGVFVIEVYSFTGNVNQLFARALTEFNESSSEQLILDFRNNPGGLLASAVDMTSHFLPAGQVVVDERYSDERKTKTHRSRGYGTVSPEATEIVVLVNAGSASASEIIAGALSDHGAATVIGQPTFGKGSIQELVELTSDTMIKITVAEWLTPDGHSFEGEGIEPKLSVEVTTEAVEAGRDPILETALDYLSGGN